MCRHHPGGQICIFSPSFHLNHPLPKQADKQSGPDALVNPQVKSIGTEAMCPCSSGLMYKVMITFVDCPKLTHLIAYQLTLSVVAAVRV